jgi:hypothetical protein
MKFTPEFTGVDDSLGLTSVFIIEETEEGLHCTQNKGTLGFVRERKTERKES